jgi:hypothetical protein
MSKHLGQIRNQSLIETIHDEQKDLGGFFDLPPKKYCNHPEHNPPKHLHIPQGKGYRHVCPRCGYHIDLIPPQISF